MDLDAQLWVAANALIAAICGVLIGLDRELADKPAGVRTHALVAAAAALVVGVGRVINESAGEGDPTRALHAVITGIGFLGAGVIYTRAQADRLSGITTAATIFFTAAVGVAVGMQAQIVGLVATVLALVILRVLPFLERRLPERGSQLSEES